MTAYDNGRNLEYRVKTILEAAGWHVVRAAGSKGPADLVAIRHGHVALLQVKGNGALPTIEWNALWLAAHRSGATPVWVWRDQRHHLHWLRPLAPKTSRSRARAEAWTDTQPETAP